LINNGLILSADLSSRPTAAWSVAYRVSFLLLIHYVENLEKYKKTLDLSMA